MIFKIGEKVIYIDEYNQSYPAFIYKIAQECIVVILESMGDKIITRTEHIRKMGKDDEKI